MSASTLRSTVRWLRPTALGGFVFVLVSSLVSVVAHSALTTSIRIRWSVGTHYGPEHAPTVAVLVVFPVTLAALYLGSRWFRTYLDRDDELTELGPVYEIGTLAVFGLVLAVQLLLIVLNL